MHGVFLIILHLCCRQIAEMSPQTVAVLGLALSLGLVVSGFPAEQPENGKHWVVIVAGSNGWYNYRHQVSVELIFEVEKVHGFFQTVSQLSYLKSVQIFCCIRVRVQADVCHAYQIIHKNGIPDEQIVVMMYDDLAQSPE